MINRKKEWVFQIWLQVSGAPTWLWVLVASAAPHTQGLLFLLLLLLQFLTVFEGNKSRSSTSGWNPRSSALLPLRPGRGAPKKTEDKKNNLRSCILTAELWNYDRAAARGSTARENRWRRRGLKLNVGPYTFFVLYIILNYYTYYIYIVLKIIKYNITRQCLEWLCQRFPQLQYVGHIQWDDYYAG